MEHHWCPVECAPMGTIAPPSLLEVLLNVLDGSLLVVSGYGVRADGRQWLSPCPVHVTVLHIFAC